LSERLVIDASALLALLNQEPGADTVEAMLLTSLISAVNWSEVVQKARAYGVETAGLEADLEGLGLEFVPFGTTEAAAAADMWHRGGRALAFADRACLATAAVRGLTAVTADRAWLSVDLDVRVQLIR
jgi:ribonuclease VapC